MTYFIWLVRIVHIVAGAFWFGGVIMMTFFVGPTLREMGEAGPKFVALLVRNRKFTVRMSIAAGLTVLAGATMYWIDSAGLTSAWMNSGAGTGFGIGGFFGAIGFVYGMLIGRTTNALVNLGGQIQGKPSPEQLTQLQSLQKRQTTYSMIASVTLLLSLIFMSIARYFTF
jgi:hypothetical protein